MYRRAFTLGLGLLALSFALSGCGKDSKTLYSSKASFTKAANKVDTLANKMRPRIAKAFGDNMQRGMQQAVAKGLAQSGEASTGKQISEQDNKAQMTANLLGGKDVAKKFNTLLQENVKADLATLLKRRGYSKKDMIELATGLSDASLNFYKIMIVSDNLMRVIDKGTLGERGSEALAIVIAGLNFLNCTQVKKSDIPNILKMLDKTKSYNYCSDVFNYIKPDDRMTLIIASGMIMQGLPNGPAKQAKAPKVTKAPSVAANKETK